MRMTKRTLAFLVVGALPELALADHVVQTNLVSDLPGIAAHQDSNLVNSWGIVHGPATPWWVADNGTGVSTIYHTDGTTFRPPVAIPGPGGTGSGTPTGILFNTNIATDFIYKGQLSVFLFVTEDGTVAAWSPADGNTARIVVDHSAFPAGAVYKGAAIGQQGTANFLYVANFHTGAVEVFDTHFAPVSLSAGAFTDPMVPAGFAPFNVLNIGGKLFVSFAMQKQPARHDESDGPGLGYVDVFDGSGTLLMRLQHGKWMNAPWGMALAPANFGHWGGRVMVGQFGSGQIATFDANNGEFEGLLGGSKGKPININGLWGLGFGNDGPAGPSNTLFFAAGLNDEANGLFGTLTAVKDDNGEGNDNNGQNGGDQDQNGDNQSNNGNDQGGGKDGGDN